jgi:hypothetical protein
MNSGRLLQLAARNEEDAAMGFRQHACDVMKLGFSRNVNGDYEFSLFRVVDYYTDFLFVFPEEQFWELDDSYPTNCFQNVHMHHRDRDDGDVQVQMNVCGKNTMRSRFRFSPLEHLREFTSVVIKPPLKSTLTHLVDQFLLTQCHIDLPRDLVNLLCDYLDQHPIPNVYVVGHYLDHDGRELARDGLLPPNVVELYRPVQSMMDTGDLKMLSSDTLCFAIQGSCTFFLETKDLPWIDTVTLVVAGHHIVQVDALWCQLHHNANSPFVILPFPPIPDLTYYQQILIRGKKGQHINLYYKEMPCPPIPRELNRLIVQIHKLTPLVYRPSETQTSVRCRAGNLALKFYFVLMYQGRPCEWISSKKEIVKTVTTTIDETQDTVTTTRHISRTIRKAHMKRLHPWKRLYISSSRVLIYDGDPEYYSVAVPTLFSHSCSPSKKYMVYEAIFHNTPPIQPYSADYMSKDPIDYLTAGVGGHFTTFNLSVRDVEITVEWDPEVIADYYPEKDSLSLVGYVETVNTLKIKDGVCGVAFL